MIRGDAVLAYRLTSERLLLVGDDELGAAFVARFAEDQMLEKHGAAAVLYELADFALRGNLDELVDADERLTRLEDDMDASVNEIPRDLDGFLVRERSRLHALKSFYRQLSDRADEIAESPAPVIPPAAAELLRALLSRSDRLAADARNLTGCALQIRTVYQSMIDIRQNRIMTVLTIVTLIFTPPTLMMGWYGMNFDNMPELREPAAYGVFMAAEAAVITGEAAYFKHRHWF